MKTAFNKRCNWQYRGFLAKKDILPFINENGSLQRSEKDLMLLERSRPEKLMGEI